MKQHAAMLTTIHENLVFSSELALALEDVASSLRCKELLLLLFSADHLGYSRGLRFFKLRSTLLQYKQRNHSSYAVIS